MNQSIRNPHGAILTLDGKQVGDTLQCCHCQAHWVPVKGSGIQRGFCMKCMQVTCGSPECDPCVPFEQQIERQLRSGPGRG